MLFGILQWICYCELRYLIHVLIYLYSLLLRNDKQDDEHGELLLQEEHVHGQAEGPGQRAPARQQPQHPQHAPQPGLPGVPGMVNIRSQGSVVV